ncbi:MAG: hypothetical protein KDA84_03815 [Planctomycetaceae bacterium]|nr:hypothetical protein [Planctomycetaceae bacterium]
MQFALVGRFAGAIHRNPGPAGSTLWTSPVQFGVDVEERPWQSQRHTANEDCRYTRTALQQSGFGLNLCLTPARTEQSGPTRGDFLICTETCGIGAPVLCREDAIQ